MVGGGGGMKVVTDFAIFSSRPYSPLSHNRYGARTNISFLRAKQTIRFGD